MSLSAGLLIELDSTDSTNNYAMRLIDADKAQPGLTITANSQTGGKGQRGKTWVDTPGQGLLMSIIAAPRHTIQQQFLFSAAVAVAIANVLQKLHSEWQINIKWPNDIIINDKKAGGVLIENVLRGSNWAHAIVGFGLNISQDSFPADIPHATSLKIASGLDFDRAMVRDLVRSGILTAIANPGPAAGQMEEYNALLYKRGRKQRFSNASGSWEAGILSTFPDGRLEVQLEDGSITHYTHGQVTWDYNSGT